jgi:hypothetical protein
MKQGTQESNIIEVPEETKQHQYNNTKQQLSADRTEMKRYDRSFKYDPYGVSFKKTSKCQQRFFST